MGVMNCPVFDPEEFVADIGRAGWEEVVEFTTDHRADDARLRCIRLAHGNCLDRCTISNDGHGVCDASNLFELVRNDDARDPLAAQALDERE